MTVFWASSRVYQGDAEAGAGKSGPPGTAFRRRARPASPRRGRGLGLPPLPQPALLLQLDQDLLLAGLELPALLQRLLQLVQVDGVDQHLLFQLQPPLGAEREALGAEPTVRKLASLEYQFVRLDADLDDLRDLLRQAAREAPRCAVAARKVQAARRVLRHALDGLDADVTAAVAALERMPDPPF
jgi:hypothetical protein